jgi:hypothetical protein
MPNLSEETVSRGVDILDLLALGVILSILTVFFVLNISIGYELGDHGYYLLHIRQPGNITYTLTQFGLAWNFIVGDYGIVINRSINILLIILSASSPVLVAELFIQRKFSSIRLASGLSVSIAAGSSYFATFIIDPSYNSVAFISVFFGISLTSIAVELSERGFRKLLLATSGALGTVVAVLLLTKLSTALAFSFFIFLVAILIAVRAKSWSLFALLLGSSLFGVLIFVSTFELTTGMLAHVVSSYSNGLRAYAAGGSHSTSLLGYGALERLFNLFRAGALGVFHGGWLLLMPIGLSAVLYGSFLKRERPSGYLNGKKFQHAISFFPCAILLLSLSFLFGDASERVTRSLLLTVFFIGAASVFLFSRWVPLDASAKILVFGAFVAPFLIVFGTTNKYSSQLIYIGAGVSLLPAWIILSFSSGHFAKGAKSIIMAVAGFTAILSMYNAAQYPYRLSGDLASVRVLTELSEGDFLTVSPRVASFINSLRDHAYSINSEVPGPTVIDLSGQLPLAIHLLNGRVAGVPWIGDFFNADFSNMVFSELDDSVFLDGWVLARVNDNGFLDTSSPQVRMFLKRLHDLDIVFDQHFEAVVTLNPPNWGRVGETFLVKLYKPVDFYE